MSMSFGNWKRFTIGDLCELVNGRAFKPSDWTETGLPIVRIQNLNNPHASFNYYDGDVRSRFLIDSGALLFAWSGTPGTSFGAHIWSGGPAILNQHIFNVLFDDKLVDKNFLRLAINQKLDELIDKAHGGVGLRHVTKGKFEETEIFLPPIEEQRRIVRTISGLLGRSRDSRDQLSHVPNLNERYKQAVLASAFRGELTTGWISTKRSNCAKQNPVSGWRTQSLQELCETNRLITYGVIKLGSEVPDGTPCLRTSNVRRLWIDIEGMKRISPKLSLEYARTILKGGEVLVNVRGTLGGVAVATPEMCGWNVSREVAVVPADKSQIDSAYLAYWIASDASQSWLRRVEKGVAYTGINLEDLRKLPVQVPPVDEQQEIVRRVQAAFLRIDAMTHEAERATALLERLDQAVLTKAFRGELKMASLDAAIPARAAAE
jgi:type I restriction enzyme, S subunit